MLILIEIAAGAACLAAPTPAMKAPSICTAAAAAFYPPMVGGYRAVSTDDAGVQAAAAFAAGQLGGELGDVESAEQQVVAGMNYRITLSLSDGRKFNVVVYRPLRGDMQLTSSESVGGGDESDTGSNQSDGD
jgi:hypothetical protein